ncbi:MAG: YeeE/YedE family protein [Burkholderiales bacterium]|nr:YeeE/YedE family protein [Burkholderiales bacterium]
MTSTIDGEADTGPQSAPAWLAGFKADYEAVFVEGWSPYLGIILVLLVILGLMISGLFWGVFGGLRLWGDWFNNAIGLGSILGLPERLQGPLLHRISLLDITLLLGAFCAALLSRQFRVSRPPKLEYIWAALGGCFMGLGATIAGGCTTGGFFTPALHSSAGAWAMWAGLLLGAAIGLKLLLWTLEHIQWGMQAPPTLAMPPALVSIYPWLGLGLVIAVLAWAANWYYSGDAALVIRGVVILSGFAIGFVMQRSRLCFARAFREPFMTAEGEMTKAVMLGLAIGIPIAALLFKGKVIDPYIAIPPRFWLGSLLGGTVFGIGMVFAGGCASGSLWRMAEGHVKLWVAVFFFAWSGSIASALAHQTGLTASEMTLDEIEATRLGYQAYFPVMLDGWGWALLASAALLLVWYALVRYNESTEKFTLL